MLRNLSPSGKRAEQHLTGGKDIRVPKYTLKRISTGEEWDITCSFDELAQHLEDDDITKVLSTPAFSSNTVSNLRRAGSEWNDHLSRIKKGSGAGNTIKT